MKEFLLLLLMTNLSFLASGQNGPNTTISDIKTSDNCSDNHRKSVLYKITEIMPTFKGCPDDSDVSDPTICTKLNLDESITRHASFIEMKKDLAQHGSVLITFIVETDGCLSGFNIRRDVCKGCGDTIVEIMKSLPRWNPGISKDGPVRVMQSYMLEIE